MNVLIIHNMRSGLRNGTVYDFARAYAENGDSVTIRTFDGSTPLRDLLTDAKHFDFVVASGGDGTLASVAYELRNSDIPILPFAAGTANLLTTNLYEPNEIHALCKTVDEGRTLNFDLGEVTTAEGTRRGFAVMAGCGYDEVIMSNADAKKKKMGEAAYFHAAFTNVTPPVATFKLTVDGKHYETYGIGIVLANFSRIQFDLMISEDNLPRDGMLDAVVLKTKNAVELLLTVFAKALDHSGSLAKKVGNLELYRGREISIEANPALMVEHDGEPTSFTTPITARCLPGAARFIVSAEAVEHFVHKE